MPSVSVTSTPEGEKAINPVGLEALLVEALRELTGRVKRLESEITALRARLERSTKAGKSTSGGANREPGATKPRRTRKKAL